MGDSKKAIWATRWWYQNTSRSFTGTWRPFPTNQVKHSEEKIGLISSSPAARQTNITYNIASWIKYINEWMNEYFQRNDARNKIISVNAMHNAHNRNTIFVIVEICFVSNCLLWLPFCSDLNYLWCCAK